MLGVGDAIGRLALGQLAPAQSIPLSIVSGWYPPFSTPVIDTRGNVSRFIGTGETYPFGIATKEYVSIDRWMEPLSQHPGLLAGLPVYQQRADWFGRAGPYPQISYVSSWWPRFEEPIRVPLRLHEANQQAFFYQDDLPNYTIGLIQWYKPFNEPIRVPLGTGLINFYPSLFSLGHPLFNTDSPKLPLNIQNNGGISENQNWNGRLDLK
jgi:hypothetical protein